MEFTQLPPEPRYPVGKAEPVTGGALFLLGLLLTNSLLYGGLNLGFALCGMGLLLTATVYLRVSGKKADAYTTILLCLSFVIFAGFARSDDGLVKFVMLCFLFVSIGLGLCLQAGQNRRDAAVFRSLADAFGSFFHLGFNGIGPGMRGLVDYLKNSGSATRNGLSVLLGLVIAVPLLLVLIPLLMSADAAFEGLMALLPDMDAQEIFATLIVGVCLSFFFFGWVTALVHAPKREAVTTAAKGLSSFTVNTVLIAVVAVYAVYLLSQLAYLVGGFSGLLPEGFSAAEYARRGFFEMAWLCAVNLTVMVLAVGLVSKQTRAPLSTRILCLFIGLVTLFLVVTASAKMVNYISAYGLTRLRLLTEVIMVFLGLTTCVVCLWLFIPRIPYMKVILPMALTIGAMVLWADVDTMVAHYNVSAYRAGALQTVDVYHLSRLGDGAVPYLSMLREDADPDIASTAKRLMDDLRDSLPDRNLRSWNYASARADALLKGD